MGALLLYFLVPDVTWNNENPEIYRWPEMLRSYWWGTSARSSVRVCGWSSMDIHSCRYRVPLPLRGLASIIKGWDVHEGPLA